MKVCKFGGSSLADATQVEKVCRIVAADPTRRFVVVSAPGKRHSEDIKVTDLLIACGDKALAGKDAGAEMQAVIERFACIHQELALPDSVLEEIRADLTGRLQADRTHVLRFMDLMKAAGEDNSARLMAAALCKFGIPAEYVSPRDAGMDVTPEYGEARLLAESAYPKLARLLDRDDVVVLPGFFGYDAEGHVATFSRGGSDITGSILAAAVKAEVYENFTDVDSVKVADPRFIGNPVDIEELTPREMRELSYAGFSVLHDEAIAPAVLAGVPICIKNTNRPELPGTRIVQSHQKTAPRVVGIASAGGFCTIYVRKYLMNREVGFGRKLLQIFEEEDISFEHTPSGIDDMSVVLAESQFSKEREARVIARILAELGADDVSVERDLALIMIVGEGMRYGVGFAARATAALANAGVNIEMMNQGSSEISMMFGVKGADRKRAVQSIYQAFYVDAPATTKAQTHQK
ncbi:MAG: aspartate kinase [Verrucomicrobia bacterium]|nr:aspartate kinase [Verrucomicrobiota bacterium]